MQNCIDNCKECWAICTETVQHCLKKGGGHAAANHIRTLLDCAEICRTSADFMLRGSDLHGYTCGACAKVCEKCAESCEQMRDDEQMGECAEACRRCAESCHEMTGAKV